MNNLNAIEKAKKYIKNIRDENFVILNNFKKEIEENNDNKTHYSTLIYDNRIENCNTILKALNKQIPMKPTHEATILRKFTCPDCKNVHEERTLYCSFCGQRLDWD